MYLKQNYYNYFKSDKKFLKNIKKMFQGYCFVFNTHDTGTFD